jgi:two-component system chemotaxis response regulator CheB
MGRDGAAELKLLREKGAVTIAQDKESCAVYGMPEAAALLGAAALVLPPEQITAALNGLAKKIISQEKY